MIAEFKAVFSQFTAIFWRWKFKANTQARLEIYGIILTMTNATAKHIEILRELTEMQKILSRESRLDLGVHATYFALHSWLYQMENKDAKLTSALKGWIPDDEIAILRAGENSSRMEEAFVQLIKNVKIKSKIKETLIKVVLYPVVLLLLSMGLTYFMAFNVFPQFSQILSKDVVLTGLAANGIAYTDWVREDGIFGLLGLLVLIVWFIWSFQNWNNPVRVRFDSFGPWKIYRMVHASNALMTLSTLLASGTKMNKAIEIMAEESSNNPWLSKRLKNIRQGLNKYGLGKALIHGGYHFPDKKFNYYIAMIYKYPSFEKALNDLSEKLVIKVIETTELMSKVILYSGLLFTASYLGFFAMSINEIVSAIQSQY